MKIRVVDKALGAVLAGAVNGRSALMRLLAETSTEPSEPDAVFIDFSGIEVATASYLRESVLAFRDIIRGRRSHYYPVIANANDTVREELIEVLRPRGGALMTCTLYADGTVADARPIGELDPKQQQTFDLVRKHRETDAGQLMSGYGESEGMKHATAWNNRLAALAALGLIVELSQGRAKRYRPLFGGA